MKKSDIPAEMEFMAQGQPDDGVGSITVDGNEPVEYFNLQGVRVDNPAGGLYIRRQGSDVRKIIIK